MPPCSSLEMIFSHSMNALTFPKIRDEYHSSFVPKLGRRCQLSTKKSVEERSTKSGFHAGLCSSWRFQEPYYWCAVCVRDP